RTSKTLEETQRGRSDEAKLTACRKVSRIYRRGTAKSSQYGHKTAMAQAHPRHCGAGLLRFGQPHQPGAMPLARVWERCSELAPLRRLELAPPERPIVT
ncbi:MAG: hypothetical protein ACLPUT_02125, partial [Solirubrobacteraceae bacterium]